MKKKKESFTYCFGIGCPDKEKCSRHKEVINKKKEYWMDAPYDHAEKKCGLFILKADNITDENGSDNGTEN